MLKMTHKRQSMEEEKGVEEMPISAAGGAPSSSRWNPTTEQLSVLEGLYMQGIRTPSADQIQQITSRLKAYGHIEGKNVFYWFQNHKARQRQKQKQERLLYFNRFLHKATPILLPPPPTCTNVVCSPYFMPNPAVGFYPQYPKVPLPGCPRRKSNSEDKQGERSKKNSCGGYELVNPVADAAHEDDNGTIGRETLQLFPLHPTGILEEILGTASPSISTVSTCNNDLSFSSRAGNEEGGREKELFNFFSKE